MSRLVAGLYPGVADPVPDDNNQISCSDIEWISRQSSINTFVEQHALSLLGRLLVVAPRPLLSIGLERCGKLAYSWDRLGNQGSEDSPKLDGDGKVGIIFAELAVRISISLACRPRSSRRSRAAPMCPRPGRITSSLIAPKCWMAMKKLEGAGVEEWKKKEPHYVSKS